MLYSLTNDTIITIPEIACKWFRSKDARFHTNGILYSQIAWSFAMQGFSVSRFALIFVKVFVFTLTQFSSSVNRNLRQWGKLILLTGLDGLWPTEIFGAILCTGNRSNFPQ